MIKFKILIVTFLLILCTFISCSDISSDVEYHKWNGRNYLGLALNKLIADSIIHKMDAFQILTKSYAVDYADTSEHFSPGCNDYVNSIYKVGEEPGFIEYSKCSNYDLKQTEGFIPHKFYSIDWNYNIFDNDSIYECEFKYPNKPIVKTSIKIPLDFGNLRTDVIHLDITKGCKLYWDNVDDGKIVLFAQLAYKKQDESLLGGSKYVFVDVIPNSGSFNVSSELLSSIGVDSLCINIAFSLTKANVQIDYFDNNTKQVATIGCIERTFSLSVY